MERTRKELRKKTRKVLRKLLKTKLRIKLSKNEFEKEEIKFLRHIIEQNDVRPNLEKVKTLKE